MAQEQIVKELEPTDNNRHFDSGAVRDTNKGKGRFDCVDLSAFADVDEVMEAISLTQLALIDGDKNTAMGFIKEAISDIVDKAGYDAILRCGKVAEKGAEKYGEGNWKRGIPASSYIDSAVRHWCKYRNGWEDENHLGSAVWSLQALHWSLENKPKCNDLYEPKYNEVRELKFNDLCEPKGKLEPVDMPEIKTYTFTCSGVKLEENK